MQLWTKYLQFIHKVRSSGIKGITTKVLEAYYNNKVDSFVYVHDLPDETVKQQLKKLKVNYIRIYFSDSMVYYGKKSHHLSIRLEPRDVETGFIFDFANNKRDLSTKKDFWDSGNKKIDDRTYISKTKSPGSR